MFKGIKEIRNHDTKYYVELQKALTFKKKLDGNDNILSAKNWKAYPVLQNSGDYIFLKPFIDIIIKEVEKNLQKKFVKLTKIAFVKTIRSSTEINDGAFLWHWDNGPLNIIDVLLYLNDVDKDCGEFEYLTTNKDEPDMNVYHKGSGGMTDINLETKKINKFLGKRGDYIIFQNNISHRATTPFKQDRYRFSLQMELS
tara:strand:- start:20586 stop:21179 length:594 start_codon:yes stop_codon:yes gene_type:complete